MKLIALSLVILIISTLTGCYLNESKFIGCYAFKAGGRAELKITKNKGKYFVSIRQRNGWSSPESLHVGSVDEIKPLFGKDSERIKTNLIADKGPFGIFFVKPGEVYGGEKAKTEYIVFLLIGGGSVYKVACK